MVHGPDGVPDRAVLRESPAQDPKPWGPWATLGFSALVYAVYFIASIGVIVWFSVQLRRDMPESKFSDIVMDLIDNGFVTSVTLVVASGLGIGLIMLLCWLRRGIEVADYLALKAFGLKTLLFWTALVIVFGVIYYLLSFIVQFQDLTALYMPLYEIAGYVSLFFLTMIVVSPLFEEIFFAAFCTGDSPPRGSELVEPFLSPRCSGRAFTFSTMPCTCRLFSPLAYCWDWHAPNRDRFISL